VKRPVTIVGHSTRPCAWEKKLPFANKKIAALAQLKFCFKTRCVSSRRRRCLEKRVREMSLCHHFLLGCCTEKKTALFPVLSLTVDMKALKNGESGESEFWGMVTN
jgi:hypothetical protein